MDMTLRIPSSTCSSLFSFLCELSSNQDTPPISVSTKLIPLKFACSSILPHDILHNLLFISLSWSLEHFSYTCWLRTFFGMPNFGNVKNTSPPMSLRWFRIFIHLQVLSASHHNHNDFVTENNRISFVGVSYFRNVSYVLALVGGKNPERSTRNMLKSTVHSSLAVHGAYVPKPHTKSENSQITDCPPKNYVLVFC